MARIRTMAMGHWWRAYNSAATHPKLGMLSDRQHRAWFNLMCMASEHGGAVPAVAEVAYVLRLSAPEAEKMLAELMKAKLFERVNGKIRPYNWDHRQFRSDSDPTATERKRRQRQKEAVTRDVTADVTPHVTRDVTHASRGPETEKEKEKEKERSAPRGAAGLPPGGEPDVVDEDPKARLFRIGKPLLISFGISEKRTGSLIGLWLKARPDPAGLLAAIQFARDENVADAIAYISALVNGKGKAHGKKFAADLARELAEQVRAAERARDAC